MSDLFRTGLAHLTEQLTTFCSRTVTYARGGDSIDVPATMGRKLLVVDQTGTAASDIRVEWTDMDFLIPAASLKLNGASITPQRKDLVIMALPDRVEVYEVFPLAYGPPWRWADPHQSMYRIHAKLVSTQPL